MKNIMTRVNVRPSATILAIASIFFVMALGACSKNNEYVEPQVDWRTKPPEVQQRVMEKVNTRDCDGLREEMNMLAEGLEPGQQVDPEMFGYIADKQAQFGCQ